MIDSRRFVPIFATLVFVLAACGGSGAVATAASDPTDAPPQSEAADPGQSEAPAGGAPAASADTALVSEPPGGGGPAADVCALVTDDELGGILGQPVQTIVFTGPPDTCDVQSSDNAPLAAFVLTTMGAAAANAVYEAFAADPGATDIGGIGEKAAYNPSQASLVILKNGSVLTVAVFDDGTSEEAARLELMKQIGSIAAGRM